jgi:hypothetical protein
LLNQTISKLGSLLSERSGAVSLCEQGYLEGKSGLLPIQQKYFETSSNDGLAFNQSILLEIDKLIGEEALLSSVKLLVSHHDALRFVYSKRDGVWEQSYGSYGGELACVDLREVEPGNLGSAIQACAAEYRESLVIEKGELVRVVLMLTGEGTKHNRLLLIVHHLVVDGVSWRILLEDLNQLLGGHLRGESVKMDRKSSSYRQWYDALADYSRSRRLLSQSGYWAGISSRYVPFAVDHGQGEEIRINDCRRYSGVLDAGYTKRLVQEVPRVYHTEINDVLLGALSSALCKWSGRPEVVIGLEGHGREDVIGEGIDTSRTVGWFTNIYPVLLEGGADTEGGSLLKGVKERLRQVPDKGLGYWVLQYLPEEGRAPGKESPPWDLVFNYLGQFDNVGGSGMLLKPAVESPGSSISGDYRVESLLTVNSVIEGGRTESGMDIQRAAL